MRGAREPPGGTANNLQSRAMKGCMPSRSAERLAGCQIPIRFRALRVAPSVACFVMGQETSQQLAPPPRRRPEPPSQPNLQARASWRHGSARGIRRHGNAPVSIPPQQPEAGYRPADQRGPSTSGFMRRGRAFAAIAVALRLRDGKAVSQLHYAAFALFRFPCPRCCSPPDTGTPNNASGLRGFTRQLL